MKTTPAVLSFAALAALGFFLAAGCSHLDLTPETDPNRVVTGTVNFRAPLPPGAEIQVRVIDASAAEFARATPRNDLPLGDRAKVPAPSERVLGEQKITLASATRDPVPFRIEFQADDALLRHGLNLDARISHGGRVRHRMINAHAITLSSVRFPQELDLEPVQ